MNVLTHLLARPVRLLAVIILVVAVLAALCPSLLTHDSAVEGVYGEQLLPPSGQHFFGTDELGRDIYARVVYGAAHSLGAALLAVLIGVGCGGMLGLIGGAMGGRVDQLLMRLVDVLLSIPVLLLCLSILILLGFGTLHAALAVGLSSVANFARLTRGEVLRICRNDYIEAAYGSGGTLVSVAWRHIVPNALPTLMAFTVLQLGHAILMLSTLSFLGYGTPPPQPEWGLMIAEGRNYMATAWWLTTFPGLAVVAVVLSTNYLSRIGRGAGS